MRIALPLSMLVLSACVARAPEPTPAEADVVATNQRPAIAPAAKIADEQGQEAPPYSPRAPKTGERAAEIRGLIDELQLISKSMPGMSGIGSLYGFAPVADATVQGGGVLLGTEPREESPAFTRLVEIGPEAIPYLLDALTDDRPTGYIARGMTWMQSGDEVHLADDVPREAAALKAHPKPKEGPMGRHPDFIEVEDQSQFYRVRVGDVCFAVLGQITNRFYLAARYQPSGGMVINTPVHSRWVSTVVRECWRVDDYRAALFAGLKIDLAEGNRNRRGRMCGAATRLLYYFGDEGARAVAARMNELKKVEDDRLLQNFIQFTRFSINRAIVDAYLEMFDNELLDATAEALLPLVLRERPEEYAEIIRTLREKEAPPHFLHGRQTVQLSRTAVLSVASRSTHSLVQKEMALTLDSVVLAGDVLACLSAAMTLRPAEALKRVKYELEFGSPYERPDGDAYALMKKLAGVLPEGAAEVVREQAQHTVASRRTAAAMVIGDVELPGWRAVLRDLLDQKDEAGFGTFEGTEMRTNMEVRLPLAYRVCDIAAIAATMRDPALKFEVKGDYAGLDQQIETIRKALDRP